MYEIIFNRINTIIYMDYYCDVCLKGIKANSKYSHFKSECHREFDKRKHIVLSHKNTDINNVDEAF